MEPGRDKCYSVRVAVSTSSNGSVAAQRNNTGRLPFCGFRSAGFRQHDVLVVGQPGGGTRPRTRRGWKGYDTHIRAPSLF